MSTSSTASFESALGPALDIIDDEMTYEIEVIQINEYNRLRIDMYDREIFRCDIRNLMFNMSVEDDPVCQRAVKAIEEAKFRMCTDQNAPGHPPYAKGRRELVTDPLKSSIQDVLPSSTDLMYEIRIPERRPSSAKQKLSLTDSKLEEKVGKVTIMEDKNTFLVENEQGEQSIEYEILKYEE